MKKIIFLLSYIVVFSSSIAKGEESYKGYRGYVDVAFGDAYNPNPSQIFSTNNMQLYMEISTTHGYTIKNWFVGAGVGYYHSFRDKENMYPIYAAGRYTFEKSKMRPYIETRAGIVYDPRWIHTVQAYGALSAGMKVYKRLQVGLRLSLFSRPSRFFTGNAAVVLSYAIGD
jgi:hypothetical protein